MPFDQLIFWIRNKGYITKVTHIDLNKLGTLYA